MLVGIPSTEATAATLDKRKNGPVSRCSVEEFIAQTRCFSHYIRYVTLPRRAGLSGSRSVAVRTPRGRPVTNISLLSRCSLSGWQQQASAPLPVVINKKKKQTNNRCPDWDILQLKIKLISPLWWTNSSQHCF